MSDIEKAREALDNMWRIGGRAREFTTAIENLAVAAMTEHANRIREIAREEIEAAGSWVCGACGAVPSPTCPHRGVAPQCGVLVRASESPPAVEAPAAGDNRPFTETARDIPHTEARQIAARLVNSHFRNPDAARVSIPANIDRDDDLLMHAYINKQERMTALARRLAATLDELAGLMWPDVPSAVTAALAEARKHKLIE